MSGVLLVPVSSPSSTFNSTNQHLASWITCYYRSYNFSFPCPQYLTLPQLPLHTSAIWMLCGLPPIGTIMRLFKSLKGDHSTTTKDEVDSSPRGPPPIREPTYQPPSGSPPSHQLHNYSADGLPPGGNEYAPPPGPPPGWQKTPNQTPMATPDADEEPPPYQYVFLESILPLVCQILET